jgi:hypothetical protein
MLRVICTNVMGRAHVSVHCVNHGDVIGHVVWSGSRRAGVESPIAELAVLVDGLSCAEDAYERGEFDFTDDC